MITRAVDFTESFLITTTNTFIISNINTDTNTVTVSKSSNIANLFIINFNTIAIGKDPVENQSIQARIL
jgi:DNA-binding protein